jgi:hypothetical protein
MQMTPSFINQYSQSFEQEAETGLTMAGRNTHTTHMYEVAFQLVTRQL